MTALVACLIFIGLLTHYEELHGRLSTVERQRGVSGQGRGRKVPGDGGEGIWRCVSRCYMVRRGVIDGRGAVGRLVGCIKDVGM